MSPATHGRPDRQTLLLFLLAVAAFASTLNLLLLGPLLLPIGAEFGQQPSTVGQVATVQSLLSALVALLAAPLLARYQQGTILQVKIGVLMLGTVVSAAAPSFGWLLAGRALAGIGGAFILASCLATVSALFPRPAERDRAVGLLWAASAVASCLGSAALLQISEQAGWRWAILALLAPLALGLAGGRWLPPRPRPTAPAPIALDYWLQGYRQVLGHRQVALLMLMVVIVYLVWGGSFVYFAGFATAQFATALPLLSLLFLLGGAAEFGASLLTPALIRRWPAPVVCRALAGLGLVTFLAITRFGVEQGWVLAPFVVVVSVVVTGLGIAINILLLEALPASADAVMALQSSAIEVGWAAGAFTAGIALAVGGFDAIYPALALPLLLLLLCLALVTRRSAPAPRPEPAAPPATAGPLRPELAETAR